MAAYKFKDCDFVLSQEELQLVFQADGQPDTAALKKFFGEKKAGTINVKGRRQTANQGKVLLYCSDCKKEYKLAYNISDINKGDGFRFSVFGKDERICICPKRTPQVRGKERDQLKSKLKEQTVSQICSSMFAMQLPPDAPPPIARSTVQTALQELRGSNDLDPKDQLNDLFMRFNSNRQNNIAEVSVYSLPGGKRFRMILLTDRTVQVLQDYLMEKTRRPFKRILLDATGKITANVQERAVLHHVLLAPIPKSASECCFLVPVGEMVTNDQTGENIGHFLRFVLSRVTATAFKRLHQIGTDDSWANVHAIFSVTPGMSVTRYLQLSFNVFKGDEASSERLACISPAYCFSHFSKNWRNDLAAAYNDAHIRHTVRAVLTQMTTIADPMELEQYIRAFFCLVLSETKTHLYFEARRVLGQLDGIEGSIEQHELEIEEPLHKTLYQDSPFYQHFNDLANNVLESFEFEIEGEPNEYHSITFFNKVLKHYLPYLPLWTIFISRLQHETAERSNNARVERSFLALKNACEDESKLLTRLGCIKLGRYADFRDSFVEKLVNEVSFDKMSQRDRTAQPRKRRVDGTSSQNLADGSITELSLSQKEEHWNKKRRSKYADYSRRCLIHEFTD